MPFSSIDPFDPHRNPFILDKSKVMQGANSIGMSQTATLTKPVVKPTNNLTVRAAMAKSDLAIDPGTGRPRPRFEISTQQIISLIVRFKLRSMTYEQLKSLPLSQLNKQEKDFVAYLRANPDMFDKIAHLDNQPGISVEDVKMASQMAADPLVLSSEDLQQLHGPQPQALLQAEPDAFLANARGLHTQDLVDTVQKLNPQGLNFDQLMNLRADQLGLQERELQALRFLQSPTVSKVLERVVLPYDNMVNPEVLRVLSSLLWNPAIYGSTPFVFYQTAPLAHEADIDPVVNVGGNGGQNIGRINKRSRSARGEQPKQVVHLEAHHVIDICHRLDPDNGQITLAQLRNYVPQNDAEEKALNLLRQAHIFQAIAGLEHEPDFLRDSDVTRALSEGAIVLTEPYIVLVILP